MKSKACFILVQFCIVLVTTAQVVTKGAWYATAYEHGIIKLSWKHATLKNIENISNAVIVKPVLPGQPVVAGTELTWPEHELKVNLKGNGLTLKGGKLNILVKEGFDSGHIRGLKFEIPANGAWFGGGERATPMQRNGQRISLYNAPAYGYGEGQDQLNYSVPFIMTTTGYGLFFDNPSKGYIDFGKTKPGELEAAFESSSPIVYLIPGSTPAEILKKYTYLTGKQPLPPLWAMGNFVSRFGYRSQQQTENVVKRMQSDSFPMDALIIDLFWFGKTIQETLGNLGWDKEKWPEPEKMIDSFAKKNIKTILITEPFTIEGTKEYTASLPHLATDADGKPYRLTEFYFGKGGIIDLFKKSSRDWFWQFYKKQSDLGVAGWWGDLGEPEQHPAGVMHDLSDQGVKRKMSANEVHNIYGHYWSQMVYENWKKDYPTKRLFFLNRAGYAGSQRFSIFPWTGDVSRSWSGFRAQLPMLQSMSLSGIPYIHSDAGGFAMTDTVNAELYTRWLQFAAFTPIFRPHGSALDDLTPDKTISLPSEPTFWDAQTKALALKTIRERYRLLPYNYTLAWEQANMGKPLIRPMMFENLQDTNLLKATDQYMWGSALLVAPVLYPGIQSRKVYIPAGNWYRWKDQSVVGGAQWIDEPVTVNQIPVFVKGGAFIPTWEKENVQNTELYKREVLLAMNWFPGINSDTSYVYMDDGETPDAQRSEKQYRLMKWYSLQSGSSVKIFGQHAGGWEPSFQMVKLLIPVDGLNALLGGSNTQRYRILVNGSDYLGGEIKPNPGATLAIFLNAGGKNEIEIQKLD